MRTWIVGSALALIVGIGAVSARAATVELQTNYSGFYGLAHNVGTMPESTLEVFNSYDGGTKTSYYIGAYNWNVTAGSSTLAVGSNIYTFCLEKTQPFSVASPSLQPLLYTFDENPAVAGSPLSGVPGEPDAGVILPEGARLLQGLITAHWANAFESTVNAAAFQLAVWEIEYDSTADGGIGLNLSTGHIWANATAGSTGAEAIAIASGWLSNLKAADVSTALALNSADAQDHLTAVPLPPAVWAGMAMLGGLFVVRRARLRA